MRRKSKSSPAFCRGFRAKVQFAACGLASTAKPQAAFFVAPVASLGAKLAALAKHVILGADEEDLALTRRIRSIPSRGCVAEHDYHVVFFRDNLAPPNDKDALARKARGKGTVTGAAPPAPGWRRIPPAAAAARSTHTRYQARLSARCPPGSPCRTLKRPGEPANPSSRTGQR